MVSYPSKFHLVTLHDQVLHVSINRPKLLNAVHKPTYLEYGEIFKLAGQDPEVRAIVLTGEGRAFCAGLDVAGMASEMSPGEDGDESRHAIHRGAFIREFQNALIQPYCINKPVIAVAHGANIGLAVDILTATDIRFAVKDAKFSIREIDLGMTADMGSLQRLPKLVGNIGWVKDVSYTGRDFDADEALTQGFVQKVFQTKDEAQAAALQLAKQLTTKSPVALFGTKKSLNYAIDHTHDESLDQIAEFNSYSLGNDFIEGSMAMMESLRTKKRSLPTFSNL